MAGNSKFVVAMAYLMAVMVLLMMLGTTRALSICNISQDELEACKPAVTEPDPAEPTEECCGALSGADLDCLCSYKNSPLLPAFGIDPHLALQLPAKCNLPSPQC